MTHRGEKTCLKERDALVRKLEKNYLRDDGLCYPENRRWFLMYLQHLHYHESKLISWGTERVPLDDTLVEHIRIMERHMPHLCPLDLGTEYILK